MLNEALLCGRPIGHFTRPAHPSVDLSVCPSVLYGLVTVTQKQKNEEKSKLV